MLWPVTLRALRVAAIFVLAALALPGPAFALPQNDTFVDATSISNLPFSDSGDLLGTTTESGEPFFCTSWQQTVWYSFEASSDTVLKVDLSGSDPGVIFAIYQSFGNDITQLGFLGCSFFQGTPFEFVATQGNKYFFQVGTGFVGSALLQLNVDAVPPPANDDFENATTIPSRPFTDNLDMTPATLQPGEPTPGGPMGSVWYSYTPATTERLTATLSLSNANPTLAVYTGGALGSLTEVASRAFGPLSFLAAGGTTYHIQVGRSASFGTNPTFATFTLDETPPPQAGFFFSPSDPSIFDNVQFFDSSFDPAQVGFQSWAWQFGDGTSGTDRFPTKRYIADGDYTVELTVTTVDGRSATASQVVHVRTHDIAITKFMVPKSASAGQTRELTVGLRNQRYPDTVQVQLSKSVPGFGGFQVVGTLTQLIPVRNGNGTTPVTFSYTFTNEDAEVGKVTFQAVVTILGSRDALNADNTAIAAPTRVNH